MRPMLALMLGEMVGCTEPKPVPKPGEEDTTADADPDAWVVIGGAATAKVIEQAVGSIVSVHQGHDPLITLQSADAAVGRWTLYDRLEYGHEVMHGFGHYDETYRKIGGQWRIASLTLTRLRVAWEDTRRTG